MLIYLPEITNRARFILRLIFRDLLGMDPDLTSEKEIFTSFPGPKINYSDTPFSDEIFLRPYGILIEKDIRSRPVHVADFEGMRAFFFVEDNRSLLPFDLFSAAFYLVTRYEEYLPYVPDEAGRYPARESLAFKGDFLRLPVVNLWVRHLLKIILDRYPGIKRREIPYRFQPTIDIDHAFAFTGRTLCRTLGGYGRSVIHFQWNQVIRRSQVLAGLGKDPFDVFDYLHELHENRGLAPIFFILFADYGGDDNNVSLKDSHFRQLVKELDRHGKVGIHPSRASNRHSDRLKAEIMGISDLLGRPVSLSRQHFLEFSLPQTYRDLLNLGIREDYSMGYAPVPGFRAGIAHPFPFFDLVKDEETSLIIHPVSLMDVTMKDYLCISPGDAEVFIRSVIDPVRAVDGELITLWHNESVSEYEEWVGWRKVYEETLKYAVK